MAAHALLLDTHRLLWAAQGERRLPAQARTLMADAKNELLHSAANLWEVTMKARLARAGFNADARLLRRGLREAGYIERPVTGRHVVAVDMLPPLHKDPFDRLLIAQAWMQELTLLTHDAAMAAYQGPARLV